MTALPMSGQLDKTAIRQEMRRRRKLLSHEAKRSASAAICQELLACREIRTLFAGVGGKAVLAVYLASPDELDLTAVIETALRHEVTVAAPRWDGRTYQLARLEGLQTEDLRLGPMGIYEPARGELVPPSSVSVWLVPGLAFTLGGERLGYGGGWYDRLLATANPHAVKLGVAHAFQVVKSLPCEVHDLRMDRVLVANCGSRAI